jgi:hypothetical protein
MTTIIDHIELFLRKAMTEELEFFNEKTLQMELAIYLLRTWPKSRIQLERPATGFGKLPPGTKKEIDICILDNTCNPFAAIEVKYPNNGRVPESMFDYCQDILFAERLVALGFHEAYAFMLTKDMSFRKGKKQDGIYQFFRGTIPISGVIKKPTKSQKKVAVTSVTIGGSYPLCWRDQYPPFIYTITSIACPGTMSV